MLDYFVLFVMEIQGSGTIFKAFHSSKFSGFYCQDQEKKGIKQMNKSKKVVRS